MCAAPNRRPVPGALSRHWVYDGISPFTPYAIKVQGNSMKMPLVGRGTENPLKQVGRRVSTSRPQAQAESLGARTL